MSDEAFSDTLSLIKKLNLTKNSSAIKKNVANHVTEFRTSILNVLNAQKTQQTRIEREIEELSCRQETLINNLISVQLKQYLNSNPKFESTVDMHTCIEDGCDTEKKEHWKFLASFYFIVTSLTSIGLFYFNFCFSSNISIYFNLIIQQKVIEV